jgi:hypothetical membrane protein
MGTQRSNRLAIMALAIGVTLPFVYYGIQLIAALFDPGYSFMRDMASVLGSAAAPRPWIWNTGMIVLGILTLISAMGFRRGLAIRGTSSVMAWIVTGAIVSNGLVSIMAGIFHLGDDRHEGGPLILGTLVLPALLAGAFWKRSDADRLRIYLLVCGVIAIAMTPIAGNAADLGLSEVRGLLQRLMTFALFPPLGVAAWQLRRHVLARMSSIR